MKVKTCLLLGAVLLLTAPTWAQGPTFGTYWGGFEDLAGGVGNSDYDYNDLVFSMTGQSLQLKSSGTWYSESKVTLQSTNTPGITGPSVGTPFWDNWSWDGNNDNVGYCIYVGCDGLSTGLAPGADYLAGGGTGTSVNDVYFSVGGNVSEQISLAIAGDDDALYYYLVGDPNHNLVALNSKGAPGQVTFTPGGDFALVGLNMNTGYFFNSDQNFAPIFSATDLSQLQTLESSLNIQYTTPTYTQDPSANHFAFFGVPEPNSIVLLGTLLLGVAGVLRRRKAA